MEDELGHAWLLILWYTGSVCLFIYKKSCLLTVPANRGLAFVPAAPPPGSSAVLSFKISKSGSDGFQRLSLGITVLLAVIFEAWRFHLDYRLALVSFLP